MPTWTVIMFIFIKGHLAGIMPTDSGTFGAENRCFTYLTVEEESMRRKYPAIMYNADVDIIFQCEQNPFKTKNPAQGGVQ